MGSLVRAFAAATTLASACAPGALHIEHALEVGDVVLAIPDADRRDATRVDVLAVGADARVDAPEASVIAVLARRDFVDARGEPQPLEGLTADLEGDGPQACSCSAPPVSAPQRVGEGDRCGLPPWVSLETVEGPLAGAPDTALRARLRLDWPGECAPRAEPLAERTVTVCPLGTAGRRVDPVRTALARDGTMVAVAGGIAVEVEPSGVVHEVPIAPALRHISSVSSFGARGSLVGAQASTLITAVRSDLVWIPGRGAGPAVHIDRGVPDGFRVYGTTVGDGSRDLWMFGTVPEGFTTVAAFYTCALAATDALDCTGGVVRGGPSCPSLHVGSVHAMVRLGDGTPLGITSDGSVFSASTLPVACLPASDHVPVRGLDGGAIDIGAIYAAAAHGRRIAACMTGRQGAMSLAVVATATIAPWRDTPPHVTWRTVAEERAPDAYCSFAGFVDPRRPERLVFTLGTRARSRAVLVATATDTLAATEIDPGDLFPETLATSHQIATTSSAIALTSEAGEMWRARLADPQLQPARIFDPPGGATPRAAIPTAGGFDVLAYDGRTARVLVPPGDGCDGVAIAAEDAVFHDDDGPLADARIAFDDGVLTWTHHDHEQRLRTAGDEITLPGEARVVSAAEVVPGAWAAFVREDGSLWATDGRGVEHLADGAWRRVSAAGGVGWVASDAALGRLLVAAGHLRLEADVLGAVDRTRFDAVPRARPARLISLRALRSGGVLLGFDEALLQKLAGELDSASAWWLRPDPAALVLTPYEALDDRRPRPLPPQRLSAIAGEDAAPILLFDGSEQSAGLNVPGPSVASLPFRDAYGLATRALPGGGADVLVLGKHLRAALVRTR